MAMRFLRRCRFLQHFHHCRAEELVEKGAEAASEAQDHVLLSAALPKALGAGCAVNRFFNKLLGAV
jgi:hypothetical protein